MERKKRGERSGERDEENMIYIEWVRERGRLLKREREGRGSERER